MKLFQVEGPVMSSSKERVGLNVEPRVDFGNAERAKTFDSEIDAIFHWASMNVKSKAPNPDFAFCWISITSLRVVNPSSHERRPREHDLRIA
jgi:hypothetical protein